MTIYESVKQEGRQEGIKIGEKKGIIKTATELKKAGADVELIMKTTGLTKKEIQKL